MAFVQELIGVLMRSLREKYPLTPLELLDLGA